MRHRGTASTPKMWPTRLALLVGLTTTTLFLQPTHAHGLDTHMHSSAMSALSALGSAPVVDRFGAPPPLEPEQHILNKRAEISSVVHVEPRIPVTTPPISFFWSTYSINDSARAIPQCSVVTFITLDNPGSTAPTAVPLYYSIIPFNAPFLNTNFSFAMFDSNSSSGGAVYPLYTIAPGNTNCSIRAPDKPVLSFTVNPPNTPCEEFKVTVKNGVAPYSVVIIAGQSGLITLVGNINTTDIYLQNIVPTGQAFNIYVYDGAGATSLSSATMTSGLYYYSCQAISQDTPGSSPPIGAIVGGVLGGIVGAVIIAALAWWWMRRRSAQVEEQYLRQQYVSEYTNLDGSKPAISPFVVSPREGNSDDMDWDASTRKNSPARPTQGAEYDHPYLQPRNPQQSPHEAYGRSPPPLQVPLRNGSGSPVSPITPASYDSTGAESNRSGPGPAFNWPAPSSSTRGAMSHQEAYESATGGSAYDPLSATSYSTAISTSGVDGLVDPNEFQPRVAGYAVAPTGPLPTGARPA
ncbi:BQ2448_5614 [Microbotryum intermedium]|uniref:BQ2448_5614 protein n=1 Tax=Microbotryum intermedium TaxID=269621 RepID=A0A238F701_9BASI|nr:BQ2448_5614 [Microbotryum intermedium]